MFFTGKKQTESSETIGATEDLNNEEDKDLVNEEKMKIQWMRKIFNL